LWTRRQEGRGSLAGLIHHHDAGSQYTSIAFTERLAAAGVQSSVGSVGDAYDNAYDNALAESVIGLFKTELVKPRGPGAPLSRSRSRPSNTPTGTTTGGYSEPAATSHQPNSKTPTTRLVTS
jgi:putative transposase